MQPAATITKLSRPDPRRAWHRLRSTPEVHAGQSFFLIDGLRGLAAVTIVLFHMKNLARSPVWDGHAETIAPGFRWLLDPVLAHGAQAVTLFWVISGAVMMHVYGPRGREVTAGDYAWRRVSRLYPLHLVTLLAIALMQAWSMARFGGFQIYEVNDPWHFLLQLGFASAWGFERGLSFNGPVWSVSAEIGAYALFLLYLRTVPVTRVTALGAVLAALALHAALSSPLSYAVFCFFLGALVRALLPGSARARAAYAGAAVLGLVAALVLPGLPQGPRMAGLFAALVALLLVVELSGRVPLKGLCRWLGEISYSSYLLHTPVMILALLLAGEAGLPATVLAQDWLLPAYLALVLGLAHLSCRYFERPLQDWLRQWQKGVKMTAMSRKQSFFPPPGARGR